MSIDCLNETDTAAKPNPVRKTYKCNVDECGKLLSRRRDLRKHIERRHSKGTKKWLDTKHNYKKHADDNNIQVSTDRKQYKCEEPGCNATFIYSNRLQRHKLIYHCLTRSFKCDFQGCEKSYINDAHLKRHKITSHSTKKDASQQVVCKVNGCGNVYCNKYVLKQHMATAHVKNVKLNSSKKKCDIEKSHRCDEPGCEAAFNRPYRLKNHKLTVHGGERPFQCNYDGCGKSYTNESHLKRHKNVSHCPEDIDTTNEVICGEEGCGRIFLNKYNLKKHIATNHQDFPFACRECDEKFKRKSQLHAHQVEIHGKEAPYKCSRCARVFIHYHLYHKHLKDHKTYQCDCGVTFDKWSLLIKHRKTECAVKREAPKCVICEKTFASKHVLREHSLLVHIPDSQIDLLQCPYLNCKYSYKYKRSLRFHIRTYHEKLFKTIRCPEKNCEVVLKSNRNLKQHLRIVHHGLPEKMRRPRRSRKDKGIPKISMASVISGVKVNDEENYKNIFGKMDDNLKEEASDKVECGQNDKVASNNNKLKSYNESCEDKISCKSKKSTKAKNKEANWSPEDKSLIGCQESIPDVVKSLPTTTNNIENADGIFENHNETTSHSVISMDLIDECSRNLNQNNSENQSTNPINKEINAQNRTSDITVLASNYGEIIMDISEPFNSPVILEMSSVQLGQHQNGEINSSQNSCNSGIVIIDFPEFENMDHSKNMQTSLSVVERSATMNIEDSIDDSYISDEEKLKKRLSVMLNDISSVLKHLENNVF